MRFQGEQEREEPEEAAQGAQEGARPRSEWRPDQVAAAEGAKRQRLEDEDATERESRDTGGSSASNRSAEDKEDGHDDEFEEGREPKELTSPEGPSIQERETHNLTHIPYRSWCEHCV